jgi:hypothetical protein
LSKAIQRLGKKANVIRMLWIDEARRLTTVHTFSKLAVKERVLYIKLVDEPQPLARRREMQDGTDGSRLHDGGESLVEVDASTLSITPKDPSCFPAFH